MLAVRFFSVAIAVLLCGCAASRFKGVDASRSVPGYTAEEIKQAYALKPDDAKQQVLEGVRQRQQAKIEREQQP